MILSHYESGGVTYFFIVIVSGHVFDPKNLLSSALSHSYHCAMFPLLSGKFSQPARFGRWDDWGQYLCWSFHILQMGHPSEALLDEAFSRHKGSAGRQFRMD